MKQTRNIGRECPPANRSLLDIPGTRKNHWSTTVFVLCVLLAAPRYISAATVNYSAQTGNFTLVTAGSAGNYNPDGTHIALWANGGGSGNAQASVGFHKFTVDGSLGGTVQPLRVGQQFSINFFRNNSPRGINNGSVGFALKNGTAFSATSDYSSGSRLEYSFTGGDSSAKIYDSGTQSSALPGFASFAGGATYTFTLVSSNEYNFTVSGGTTYNIFTLGGTANGALDSFSIFNRGNNDDYTYGNISVQDIALSYTANSGETKTVTGIIPDNGSLANTTEKLGVGTVIFAAANSYSGLTKVTAGNLIIQNVNGLGGSSTGTVVSAGASLQLTNNISGLAEPITIVGQTNNAFTGTDTTGALRSLAGTNSVSGLVTLGSQVAINSDAGLLSLANVTNAGFRLIVGGAGNLAINGAYTGPGALLKQGAGVLSLNVSNAFGGTNAIFHDNGTVLVGASGALGTTDGTGTGYFNLGASSAGAAGNVSLLIASNGVSVANPIDVRYFSAVSSGKVLGANASNITVTFAGPIALHDSATLNAPGGSVVSIPGAITLNGGITSSETNIANLLFSAGPGVAKTGGGTVEFSGANTFPGETYVRDGTLQFNGAGSYPSTIRVGDDVAASTVTVNIANAAGGGNVSGTVNTRTGAGGTKTLGASNTSGTNTYSGGVFLDGNLTTSSANSGSVLAFGGSTFDLKNQALTVTGAGDTEIRNPVINSTGTGRVLKLGTGALVLKGTNTYGGATVVSNGTLVVHGSLAGAVAVSSGTVLSGTGTVSGVVTNNGTIAPGSGIATLTVGSTPLLNGTLLMEINRNGGSPLADKLARSGGGLTYSGALVVTNIGAVAQSGDTFTLFNASSYSGTFSSVTLPPGGTAHWKTNNLVVDGTITFTNNNPVAQNLVLGVARGGTISYPVIGVGKHSATDADGDVIAVTAVSAATNGTAGFTASNLTYTASGVVGSDTFTYTVSDPAGGADTRTVTVMITNPEGFNRLSPPSVIGAGTVALSYLGVPNASYALDWATNLTPPIDWVGVATNTASASGSLLFTNSSSASQNYFRTRYVEP